MLIEKRMRISRSFGAARVNEVEEYSETEYAETTSDDEDESDEATEEQKKRRRHRDEEEARDQPRLSNPDIQYQGSQIPPQSPSCHASERQCPESYRRSKSRPNIPSTEAYHPDIESRWHTLLAREAELDARQSCIEEAEERVQREGEDLMVRQVELRRQEEKLHMAVQALWNEEGRSGHSGPSIGRERWRFGGRYQRSKKRWPPNIPFEDVGWEDLEGYGMDGGDVENVSDEFRVPGKSRRWEFQDLNIEAQKAFEGYNTHWEQLPRPSFGKRRVRYPTLSGSPSDLLTQSPNHEHRPPGFFISKNQHCPDDRIQQNVYAFFLNAFSISIIEPRASRFIPLATEPQLDLSNASPDRVQKLRDHLLRKEFNRWHPDKLGRISEDGEKPKAEE
ncbi:hypothetical protein P280DRAFT_518838 [Massarina eburnea CBS 473.64]|uniref:Uncharacterized protein n=1 Tax=Massarina eburnea CBS 473.64 TaxID=1395130 RepID=A0A6A6RYI6_9PLEO|nr:hypothetical protein P280DRAFT_518838 [Massarina eburnea CBS 473.64]